MRPTMETHQGVVWGRLCALAVAAAASAAGGAEIWVDAASQAAAPDGTKAAAFRTIGSGLKAVSPGDTVILRAGVYRESVRVPGGQAGKPVTLRAAPGQRVIVSGAVPVGQWKRHDGGVYTATLDFRPARLLVGHRELPVARQPNEGWWAVQAADQLTLRAAAAEKLKAVPAEFAGGQAYIWTRHGNTFFTVPVAAIDRDKGAVTVVRKSKWMTLGAGDRLRLQNHPSLIDRPGEWAVVPEGAEGRMFRLYYRPAAAADLARVVAPRETRQVISVYSAGHVRIEGLEVAAAQGSGIAVNRSHDVTITRCIVHNNGKSGIALRDCRDVTVSRCIVRRNYTGVTLHTMTRSTVEQCDIGHNGMDGLIISWNSSDVTARRNYLHHHLLWGHPDNLQLYRGVKNIRFIDNLLLAAGQSIMMEEVTGGLMQGNMIVGSAAYSVIFGHRNTTDFRVHNNTVAFTGYGCMSLTARDYDVKGNVFVTGHAGPMYGTRGVKGYTGDRNLFWNAPGLTRATVLASDKAWHRTLGDFQAATGQDKESVYGDPKFRSAPQGLAAIDSRRLTECTRDTWPLRRGHPPFSAAQTVEVNFDGVPRKVTAVRGDTITVTPPLPAKPTKGWIVANWGDKTDLALDLRLAADSPGAKLAADGGAVGSKVDIAAYRRGDFDADGKRDLPAVPKELMP